MPVEKSNTTVVIATTKYDHKVTKMLSTDTYKRLPRNPILANECKINNKLQCLLQSQAISTPTYCLKQHRITNFSQYVWILVNVFVDQECSSKLLGKKNLSIQSKIFICWFVFTFSNFVCIFSKTDLLTIRKTKAINDLIVPSSITFCNYCKENGWECV